MKKKSKLAEEIELIALLAFLIPTAIVLTTTPLWWYVASIKVFAGWMVGIVVTAALLGCISLYDESEQEKERERDG